MSKINIVINEATRSIEVSYKIPNEKVDEALSHAITDIVRENKLECSFGEEDNHLRYFHISGINLQNVIAAKDRIEKLN